MFVATAFAFLLWLQNHALHAEIAHVLEGEREPVTPLRTDSSGDGATLTVPVPAAYQALVTGPADSLENPGDAHRTYSYAVPWDVRASADRLLLTIGGPDCPAGTWSLTMTYATRPFTWQPFSHERTVTTTTDPAARVLAILPAFYRPSQAFRAIVLPPGHGHCVTSVERLVASSRLPSSFGAVLAPGWQTALLALKPW